MLKKILMAIGLLFVTVVAAGAIFWFGYLTPPESNEVCTNVNTIFDKEVHKLVAEKTKGKKLPKSWEKLAQDEAKKGAKEHCERFSTEKPLMMAQAVWVKRLKCMRDASDIDGLEKCDEIKKF